MVYRVAQEALTNVARHAGVDAAALRLAQRDGTVELVVSDDGRGFRVDASTPTVGIRGMRERALLVGAELELQSSPGGGHRPCGSSYPPPHRHERAAVARVLLADDHAVVRRGLQLVLEAEPDLAVVAEAGDGAEAVDAVAAHDIDLAVLDVAMPRLTGLQAASRITQQHARRPRAHALDARQRALLLRGAEGRRVGLRAQVGRRPRPRRGLSGHAARGAVPLPGSGAALIRDYLERAREGDATPTDPLTPREVEVVKLIAEAHTNEQIAALLVISRNTVERHRANILEKLGMRDRVELTRYAIRRGLVEP